MLFEGSSSEDESLKVWKRKECFGKECLVRYWVFYRILEVFLEVIGVGLSCLEYRHVVTEL